jgi:hypothetical protein
LGPAEAVAELAAGGFDVAAERAETRFDVSATAVG